MTISLIAALDKNNALGLNNQLLCSIPEDLRYFKQKTLNKVCIMGRNTFQSIGRPLPSRTNIVLTQDPTYSPNGVYIYDSITDILEEYNRYTLPDEEVFVIGGSSLYFQFLPYADRLYLTHINHTFEADAYFPPIYYSQWDLVESHKGNECKEFDYYFNVYDRK
jgi:dihydrofolate reductase